MKSIQSPSNLQVCEQFPGTTHQIFLHGEAPAHANQVGDDFANADLDLFIKAKDVSYELMQKHCETPVIEQIEKSHDLCCTYGCKTVYPFTEII